MSAPYQVYAIRYGHVEFRGDQVFIGGDPHDGPYGLDYYVWAAISPERSFVIDMGFTKEAARERKREFIRDPIDSLRLIGIDPETVADVVVTHLHYDHIGNFDRFPLATYHLQDREMAFATGRYMNDSHMRHAFDVESVTGIVRKLYGGRVRFHDGDVELAPGLSLHWIGGHTAGLQSVRIWTQRGWLVLASDASHFYANIEGPRPYPVVYSVDQMLLGYRTLRSLADSPKHIIPGHDPLVMARYPAPRPELEGIVARLDLEPSE